MVCNARDAAQRVVRVVTLRVHLTHDRVFGAVHRRQRGHRGAYAVAAMVATDWLQRPGRIGQPQFGCVAE
jgi:hypothetical protein